MADELTTEDLADTLEYWKSRAIRAEKLLQGYVDRELGNTLGGPTQANTDEAAKIGCIACGSPNADCDCDEAGES